MNFIAVDLGNTRTKFGYFYGERIGFSEPDTVLVDDEVEALFDMLRLSDEPTEWRIARTLVGPLPVGQMFPRYGVELRHGDVPMDVSVEQPDKVGIDRLLAAFGAVEWRKSRGERNHFCTLVVDAGSAMTVDLVDPEGVFCGGAILPGLEVAATAVSTISPRLPKISIDALVSSCRFPGKNTEDAIAAGIIFGAVGAILHLHQNARTQFPNADIPIILTGGDAEKLYGCLADHFVPSQLIYLPHLVLSAIALTHQA